MPRQAYLNELSFNTRHVPIELGRELFEQLFRLLREIDRRSTGVTVIGHRRLSELSIGDCLVGTWLRNDPDRKRWLRVIDNRAPFDPDIDGIAEEMDSALEYRHGEHSAIGLGLASWHDELAVSVDVEPWQAERVKLQCYQVFEDDAGNVDDKTSNVLARNAANFAHLHAHKHWLESPGKDLPRTPDELWLNRRQWYPNMAFTGRAERQVRALSARSPAVRQVAGKLLALQDSLVDWTGVGQPQWQINVVPENPGRERYCRFEDLDGETRLFELHVRYAPGQNRIHFRLDVPNRRIVVAHVGAQARHLNALRSANRLDRHALVRRRPHRATATAQTSRPAAPQEAEEGAPTSEPAVFLGLWSSCREGADACRTRMGLNAHRYQ